MSVIVSLILLIVGMVAVGVLQVVLAKRTAWWPGLILPALFVVVSLVAVIWVALPTVDAPGLQRFIAGMLTFLLCNIPTLLLLGLYGYCRRAPHTEEDDETGAP